MALAAIFIINVGSNAAPPTLTSTTDVGTVTDADIVPTSFNEVVKTSIKTTKGVFFVVGMPSVMIGAQATMEVYDNGREYLCVGGWAECAEIF